MDGEDWDFWIRGFVDGEDWDLWIRGFVDGEAEDSFLSAEDAKGREEEQRRGGFCWRWLASPGGSGCRKE